VLLRINPGIDVHTHSKIATGVNVRVIRSTITTVLNKTEPAKS